MLRRQYIKAARAFAPHAEYLTFRQEYRPQPRHRARGVRGSRIANRRRSGRKWHEKPEFLKLRRQWYATLKRKGFHDCEFTNWETGESREYIDGISQADVCNTYTPEQERYYQLAAQWTWVMKYRRKKRLAKALSLPPLVRARDLKVWDMHAEGHSYRSIGRKVGIGKGTVGGIIARERELMLGFDWDVLEELDLD